MVMTSGRWEVRQQGVGGAAQAREQGPKSRGEEWVCGAEQEPQRTDPWEAGLEGRAPGACWTWSLSPKMGRGQGCEGQSRG